jgi:hypothetical protein
MDDDQLDSEEIREGDSLVKPLPEDHSTPAAPPTDPIDDMSEDLDQRTASGRLDPTHQATDNASDIDAHEMYDEGLSGAAEAEEPNAGNTVVNYDPEKDQRNQDAA